jgi:hypothetical protein
MSGSGALHIVSFSQVLQIFWERVANSWWER